MAVSPPIQNPAGDVTASAGFVCRTTFQGVIGTTSATPIAPADPDRLVLLAISDVSIANWGVSPGQDVGGFGLHGISGTNCVIIHSATLPGICQAAWFASADVPAVSLRVYSVSRSTSGE